MTTSTKQKPADLEDPSTSSESQGPCQNSFVKRALIASWTNLKAHNDHDILGNRPYMLSAITGLCFFLGVLDIYVRFSPLSAKEHQSQPIILSNNDKLYAVAIYTTSFLMSLLDYAKRFYNSSKSPYGAFKAHSNEYSYGLFGKIPTKIRDYIAGPAFPEFMLHPERRKQPEYGMMQITPPMLQHPADPLGDAIIIGAVCGTIATLVMLNLTGTQLFIPIVLLTGFVDYAYRHNTANRKSLFSVTKDHANNLRKNTVIAFDRCTTNLLCRHTA